MNMKIESPIDRWMSDPFDPMWSWLYDSAPYILIGVLALLVIVTPILAYLSRKPLMWADETDEHDE